MSIGRKTDMGARRGYLLIAMVLVVIKMAQIAVGGWTSTVGGPWDG